MLSFYFLVSGQMDNQIVVSDYAQMDRVLREERAYILNLVKQIKKAGCNVLLIQKSILRYRSNRRARVWVFFCFLKGNQIFDNLIVVSRKETTQYTYEV